MVNSVLPNDEIAMILGYLLAVNNQILILSTERIRGRWFKEFGFCKRNTEEGVKKSEQGTLHTFKSHFSSNLPVEGTCNDPHTWDIEVILLC